MDAVPGLWLCLKKLASCLGGVAKIYPAYIFRGGSASGELVMILKRLLIAGCAFLPLLTIRAGNTAQPGFLEGHLKIISLKEVELAGGNPPKYTTENYAEYPLVVLSKDRQQEVARISPDRDGNYRVSLPPGDYVLDVQGRRPGGVRAKPQPFTVVSEQTVQVDMEIDMGIR
jgi:hypothetical protein